MLRLTVSMGEYLKVGENVKIVFLGGSKNHLRIMIDAPKNIDIIRSKIDNNKEAAPESQS